MRVDVVAEWNIRQEDAEEAARKRNRRRGRRTPEASPPPRRHAPPQSPSAGLALLGNAEHVNVTPDAAAFWFSNGLVHVE